ncbi:hypothetical protein [Jiangella sp. DSM 45060]|uniref:hypothetical protein n=1 Tax=Jiangella sp. DSM 45060 TaxID=1798224 RepID=UPI00087A6AFB|nr:hypothetical protein [Jiangella sp. DSM 45060]SDS09401.1 hypothetical protein SAMN04515669_0320 [Jiangella sp. DSM 45060]
MSSSLDDVAANLRDDPLYVDPAAVDELNAEGFTFDGGAESSVRDAINGADTPFYVAVLPADAADSGAARTLSGTLGDGTYLVIFGDTNLSAGSTEIDNNVAQAASSALSDGGDDLGTGITNFIESAERVIADGGSGAGGGGGGGGTGSGDSGGGGLLPLAILAAAGGGGFLLYRRNKRSKERAQLEQVRGALEEDITKYGERLSELDLDLRHDSKVPIEARNEYGRALDLYENAKTFADRAERPTDLKPVTTALEEGRWLLACVDARVKGAPLPERRLPCFFDPGHGPSVEDVEWAPMGGAPRTVPACAADAMRVKAGADPETRMVPVGDGERRPYYDAGPAYGGWAGGYFGGLLPGMLMGTMLGSALSNPVYIDGGGGGDGGGGDWGGGDFGGGDWGGGDFGGGDFGGGDF